MADFERNINEESQDEYLERLQRIEREIAKYNNSEHKNNKKSNVNKNNTTKVKANKKRKVKRGFLKTTKTIIKKIGVASLILGGMWTTIVGLSELAVHSTEGVNGVIKNGDYEKAKNIEAGYYNKHPLKICISDKFNTFYQFTMRKALQYLDERAEGLTFDIVVGDVQEENANLSVIDGYSSDYNREMSFSELGHAPMFNGTEKTIYGNIVINTNAPHLLSPAQTVLHECLHALGLYHSDNPFSAMYPYPVIPGMSQQDIDNINTIFPAEDSASTYQYDDKLQTFVHVFDSSSYDVDLIKQIKQEIKERNNKNTKTNDLNM